MPSSWGANCHPPGFNIPPNASDPDGSNQNPVFGGGAEGWVFLWRFEGHSRERKSCNPGFAFRAGGMEPKFQRLERPNFKFLSRAIPKNFKEFPELFPKFPELFQKKSGGTVELAIRYQDPHPLGIFPRWEPFPCNSKRGPFFRPGSIQFLILVSTRVRKRPWTGTINLWLSLIGLA